MAITNQERVGKAMDLLKQGLAPFVHRECNSQHLGKPDQLANRYLKGDTGVGNKPVTEWDVSPLLILMWGAWNDAFSKVLGNAERSLVQELRDWRNKWAHQETFSGDDTYRVLDSADRLLTAISSPLADDVSKMKTELMRLVYGEQVRQETRKTTAALIESPNAASLKPWREVIEPHSDVASGNYQNAEFAADLWQVHIGEGSDEYRDPREFFRRTYLTESLKDLLVNAVQRVGGVGGEPVVQLQTNFGGGKTHSMLALFHLFSGCPPAELHGLEKVMAEAGVSQLPSAKRVVLAGNKIPPGMPTTKPDGTVVRTLWGELAYQLGGRAAFDRIAEADANGTSPGDVLRELFVEYGPCIILVDEWVAYARQLHDEGEDSLPGGSFQSQISFAQALSESAKGAQGCLLVASLPASEAQTGVYAEADNAEVGGVRGRQALSALSANIGRTDRPWRSATAEESFEIVRRRLFADILGDDNFKQRDVTAKAFAELYAQQKNEFPPECIEANYEKRIQAAYPIHPEIFDRLYTDWSTLVKFQRTRGVLRLMAAVIHSLWEKGDQTPLILPSTIPIDDLRVQSELTRFLSDNWTPIIEKDVDGPNSLPLKIDGENPNLGKYNATRRVARTIYLGSAPTAEGPNRGVEDRRVKLGCVMPGETPAVFGDALRRLASAATYLYQDGPRSWYATQPTVTKLAEDRSEQLKRDPDKVANELERRLREDLKNPGEFSHVHPMAKSGADVQDDIGARLVVLPPEYGHAREGSSPAQQAAKEILESRGNGPRRYQNTLVFLAADSVSMQDLEESLRKYLAWTSVINDIDDLNLDRHQINQARTQQAAADGTVGARLPEVYRWVLVPEQKKETQAPVKWAAVRLAGTEPLAVRVSKKLKSADLLVTSLHSTFLRKYLDDIPLWRGDDVQVAQLVEDFACYLYLPRVARPEVLVQAMRDGVALNTWEMETFAYAEGKDASAGRYQGLQAGQLVALTADSTGLLVKPDVTRKQWDSEVPSGTGTGTDPGKTEGALGPTTGPSAPKSRPRRYHGTRELDPTRVGRDAGQIAEEVIAHLVGLKDANVRVTLEIEAEIPDGASEQVVRIVMQNGTDLKFSDHAFEND